MQRRFQKIAVLRQRPKLLDKWRHLTKKSIEERVKSTRLTFLKAWKSSLYQNYLSKRALSFQRNQGQKYVWRWRRQLGMQRWMLQMADSASSQLSLHKLFRTWRRRADPNRTIKHVSFVTEPLVRIYSRPSSIDVTPVRKEAQKWINETPKPLRSIPLKPIHSSNRSPSKLTNTIISEDDEDYDTTPIARPSNIFVLTM